VDVVRDNSHYRADDRRIAPLVTITSGVETAIRLCHHVGVAGGRDIPATMAMYEFESERKAAGLVFPAKRLLTITKKRADASAGD
jgi:hypothetical protein